MKSPSAEAYYPEQHSKIQQEPPRLTIVIVSYNVRKFLEQTLRSVHKATEEVAAETIVVDNASVDGTVEMVVEKFPEVQMIANKENLGFSKANNQAIRLSSSEYVLLLNPDTILQEDTLRVCMDFMDEHQDAGAAGVRMLDGRGHFLPESKRGLPTPETAFYKLAGLSKLFPSSPRFCKYHMGHLDEFENHKVEVLSGAFMFMRRSALEQSGLLDETFFMYGEDIDLSYRITQEGYANYYLADTSIIHYKGESTKKGSLNYVFHFYNAMAIFAKKHYSRSKAGLFSLAIQLAILFQASLAAGKRFLHALRLPMMDFVLGLALMVGFSLFWEQSFKAEPNPFPDIMLTLVMPVYVGIWMLSGWLIGIYDFPYRIGNLMVSTLVGMVFVSAMVNFIEALRYSKAVILFGFPLLFLAFLFTRLLETTLRTGHFSLGDGRRKKVIVLARQQNYETILDLIQASNSHIEIVGSIWYQSFHTTKGTYLGPVDKVNSLKAIYRADEIIFAGADFNMETIIDIISSFERPSPEFKILPSGADFIIGSHSKNTNGDFYMANIRLAFEDPARQRFKRFMEFCFALVLLLLFPLIGWFVPQPTYFLKNLFLILLGEFTFVGPDNRFYETKVTRTPLITPSLESKDEIKARQLNLLYLKNYQFEEDFRLTLKFFYKLTRK